MTTPHDPIEEQLSRLHWWDEPAPGVWKQALAESQRAEAIRPLRWRRLPARMGAVGRRVLLWRWTWVAPPAAAMIVLAVIGGLREKGSMTPLSSSVASEAIGVPQSVDAPRFESLGFDFDGDLADSYGIQQGAWNRSISVGGMIIAGDDSRSFPAAASPDGRQVVMKAAIDLQVEDVRSLYLKVQALLVSEAGGEYVERAEIHDQGDLPQAYLTLRVRKERLSDVLDKLRSMGKVLDEQTEAADVTSQVTDVEARLRNDRRVEQELLELLDRRSDAPLEDILKVNESLRQVRERIEQLVAQQQQLSRQVQLATVVVTICPNPREDSPKNTSVQFIPRLKEAWTNGLVFLAGSTAFLVTVLVGGFIWWVPLVVCLWLMRRWAVRRLES